VERTSPHALPWGGATLPAFGASLGLGLALGAATRRLVPLPD
jgi:hypothetical protein